MNCLASIQDQERAIAEIRSYLFKLQRSLTNSSPKSATVVRHVLEQGKPFYITEESFSGRRLRQKLCYSNAVRHSQIHPELTYVEGYVLSERSIIEHAWTVNARGCVVDPTFKHDPNASEPIGYFGVPFDALTLTGRGVSS